jgi:hypothetical protein
VLGVLAFILLRCKSGLVDGIHEASSKGWMSFFLVNRSQNGRFSVLRSATASLRICDVFWPETKSVVLGFSFCSGSRWAIARFARAFLGFLGLLGCDSRAPRLSGTYTVFNILPFCRGGMAAAEGAACGSEES